MNFSILVVILFLTLRLNNAQKNDAANDFLENYDDDLLDDSELDDDFDSALNVIGRRDELRQIILNPRKRRQRRKNHQAAFSQLMSLEHCWTVHDKCDSLNTNEIKFGLKNEEEQRFWHCNCDTEFYDCLHRLNSTLSNHIGELYFSYNYRCYRINHEAQKCREYDRRGGPNSQERCVQYILLLNTQMRNQWFDLPYYSGQPMKNPLFVVKGL